jgi:amino acid transporter
VNVLRTARAVAWSFLGIRRGAGLEEDMKQLNPVHVILVALVGVLLLVGGLAMLVHWIV